ncbi:MAG: hypothetical protein DBX55_02145 [Verrucomicrobia bacterium]|nr:MAG: hypothetical protein DBX55_02145 [Verrucomicrobiota bacterium]
MNNFLNKFLAFCRKKFSRSEAAFLGESGVRADFLCGNQAVFRFLSWDLYLPVNELAWRREQKICVFSPVCGAFFEFSKGIGQKIFFGERFGCGAGELRFCLKPSADWARIFYLSARRWQCFGGDLRALAKRGGVNGNVKNVGLRIGVGELNPPPGFCRKIFNSDSRKNFCALQCLRASMFAHFNLCAEGGRAFL